MSQTQKQVKMTAKQVSTIPLSVSFSRPGVYNINSLAVFVAYKDDISEMTLQKQTKPSVITVTET